MKRVVVFFTVLVLALTLVLPVCAADGQVNYSGNAGMFIFAPGSEHSLTDLFPNFKGVMPGDRLTQTITVKNDADNRVKVKIYIRSLGAGEDSADFLSQLGLKVAKSTENKMAYMFDAAANETAGLTDWIYLGMLYSGGKVHLDVTLTVPVALSNEYQNKVGYLGWEFRVEEFPVEPDDPTPPQTGDDTNIALWLAAMLCSGVMLLTCWKKGRAKGECAENC